MDENIGIHDQAFELGNVLGLAEVKRHGPFVAIDRLKRRAVIVPKGRPSTSIVAAVGLFYFDYIGAEIPKDGPGHRPREVGADLNHPHPG